MLCCAQLCLTLCNPMDCSTPGSSVHGDSPGKNTGMGCHALLQGIFPAQGLNPDLPHCRWILYWLSHQGLGAVKKRWTGNFLVVQWLGLGTFTVRALVQSLVGELKCHVLHSHEIRWLLLGWNAVTNLVSDSRSVVSDSLQPHGLYCPWNSPGQNTAGLPHCRKILTSWVTRALDSVLKSKDVTLPTKPQQSSI